MNNYNLWGTPGDASYNQMAMLFNYYQLQQLSNPQHFLQQLPAIPSTQQNFLQQLLAAQTQYMAQLTQQHKNVEEAAKKTEDATKAPKAPKEEPPKVDPPKAAEPTTPEEPVKPVEPVEPIKPVEPVEPVEPIKPATPVKPTEPTEPQPEVVVEKIEESILIKKIEGTEKAEKPEGPKQEKPAEVQPKQTPSSRKAPSARLKKKKPQTAKPTTKSDSEVSTDDETFDMIQGRLAMSTNNTRYYISKDEMWRRVEGPENLNSSSLACNLKRPKLKNGGEIMRAQITELGFSCRLNTRQNVYPNKMIGMCESEVANLVKDLETVCASDYPSEQIGREVVEECGEDDKDTLTAITDKTDDFLECMKSLKSCMDLVMPPITGIEPKACDDSKFNLEMEKFSCYTHGFGPLAQKVWLDQLTDIGKAISTTKKK